MTAFAPTVRFMPATSCPSTSAMPIADLAAARHDAVGVDHPARVLVPAVHLVEHLQQVAGGRCRCRGLAGRMPERAPVVVERRQLVGGTGDAATHVGHGEGGPVRQVALGGRPVRGEVAPGDLGEGVVAVEAPRFGHAIGEQRVGVLTVARRAAGHEALELEEAEQEHQLKTGELLAAVGERAGDVVASAIGCRGELLLDRLGERVHAIGDRVQLLLEDRPHARRREVLQPLHVIGVHVVPRRAKHVGAQHATVGECCGQVALAGRRRARRNRPRRLRGVLGLHGNE